MLEVAGKTALHLYDIVIHRAAWRDGWRDYASLDLSDRTNRLTVRLDRAGAVIGDLVAGSSVIYAEDDVRG